jgi:hypothetical protein
VDKLYPEHSLSVRCVLFVCFKHLACYTFKHLITDAPSSTCSSIISRSTTTCHSYEHVTMVSGSAMTLEPNRPPTGHQRKRSWAENRESRSRSRSPKHPGDDQPKSSAMVRLRLSLRFLVYWVQRTMCVHSWTTAMVRPLVLNSTVSGALVLVEDNIWI